MLDLRLGHFHLQTLLGTGGMGSVWQARYVGPGAETLPAELRRDVAVKVMTAQWAQQPEWRDAFATEIRAVARLNHPSIPAIFDFGEVPAGLSTGTEQGIATGSPWFATEMCSGGTLSARGGTMRWPDIRRVLIALLDALAHAHSRGLIHRDLKAANVLFDGPDDTPQLVDFGLAIDTQPGSTNPLSHIVVGTPSSMAPEQFDGRTRDFGPWTDLYALGCLTHRMVCGQHPYGPRDVEALRQAHRTWPLPSLDNQIPVPPGLQRWVHGLIAKEPADRFGLAADAKAALLALETAPATEKPTANDWRSPDRPHSRRLRTTGLPLFGLRPIPFVGREPHRDQLRNQLAEVTTHQRPQAVALTGPAGVGKTRLASWLAETAHSQGRAHTMQALHGTQVSDAQGLEAMMRRALGTQGLSRRDIFERLDQRWAGRIEAPALHALSHLLAQPQEPTAFTEAERHTLLRLALEQQARTRPLIVILDDVHVSADAIGFVHTVLQTAENLPVLFVLTARTEDLAARPTVRQTLEALLDTPQAHRLAVEALPPDDATRFVGQMLGFRADLQGRVTERIGGNPLFAVQLVSDWAARGLLTPDGEGYHLADSGPVSMPADLHAVWDARLNTFVANRPPQHETALEAAAALGGPVDTKEWMRVCARLNAAPGNLLRDLLDQGLASAGEHGWDLVHGMLREALHQRAKAANRWAPIQAACAAALQDTTHDHTRLGRHLLAAGQTNRAIPELMEGLEADMRFGNLARAEQTAHQVQQALPTDTTPAPTLAAAALQRAQLARLRGRIHAAQRELDGCESAIDDRCHPRLAANACAEAALIAYRAGDLARVIEKAHAGERLAKGAGATDLMARCLEVRARALTDRAEWHTARETYQQARQAFEATHDAMRIATCDLGSGWVACSEGALDQADAHIRSGLETFERLGNQEQMGTAHNMLGEVARARGTIDAAAEHYRLALGLHDNCGASASATIAALNLAIVLVAADKAGEARDKVTRRLRTMVGLGHEQFVDAAKLVLLVCDAQQGRWDGWLDRFEVVYQSLSESEQAHQDLAALAARAATHATDDGRPAEAVAATRLAVDQRKRLGS